MKRRRCNIYLVMCWQGQTTWSNLLLLLLIMLILVLVIAVLLYRYFHCSQVECPKSTCVATNFIVIAFVQKEDFTDFQSKFIVHFFLHPFLLLPSLCLILLYVFVSITMCVIMMMLWTTLIVNPNSTTSTFLAKKVSSSHLNLFISTLHQLPWHPMRYKLSNQLHMCYLHFHFCFYRPSCFHTKHHFTFLYSQFTHFCRVLLRPYHRHYHLSHVHTCTLPFYLPPCMTRQSQLTMKVVNCAVSFTEFVLPLPFLAAHAPMLVIVCYLAVMAHLWCLASLYLFLHQYWV